MTYTEATDFLFTQLPMFQNIGAGAYKPGLDTTLRLAAAFGNPHKSLRTIHVGGTNGKGSTAHSLASVLQHSGYKVGLFTSPHLVDFRERIRVNGTMIEEASVIDFVERYKMTGDTLTHPTFFELTTVMAFEYFARCGVDIAVIEVGLGGRLDSTNIITPELSVITNISKDHTALLGDTIVAIASEKAGIIKPGVPVVIGEADGDVLNVFVDAAMSAGSEIVVASQQATFSSVSQCGDKLHYADTPYGDIDCDLTGDCQKHNFATVMCCLEALGRRGWIINADAVRNGLATVCTTSGLMGRWMVLNRQPLTVCDTGHNEGGWQYLSQRLKRYGDHCHIVIGFVNDKDVNTILSMMPKGAQYYFTQAGVRRALPSASLQTIAIDYGLNGECYDSVAEAYKTAASKAKSDDIIFIGGSTFIVADLLSSVYNNAVNV